MKTFALLPLLFLTTALSSTAPQVAAQATAMQELDRIVAVVEDDVILNSELEQSIKNIEAQYKTQPERLPPRHVLEKQVLERLILTKLQVQRAEAGGIRVSDSEVDNAISSIAQRNSMSAEQLRQKIANDGLSFQTFQNSIREELVMQRLQQGIARSRVVVTDNEVDLALQNNKSRGGEVRLGNILVALPDGATPEQIEIAQKKVSGIAEVIAKDKITFEAAAVRFSDAPDALEGGLTDWRSLDSFPPQLVNLLNEMSVGQVSQPLRTPAGYVLIQLADRRDQAATTQTETQYQTEGIMVEINDTRSSEQAKAEITKLRDRIANGDDFAELARKYSDDNINKNKGGDMGWISAYAYGTAVGDVLTNLSAGQLSEPFQSDAGWHIVRVKDIREVDAASENERARVRETIGRRKAEEEYQRFLREMRSEAFVDVLVPGLGEVPKTESDKSSNDENS